MSTPTFPKNQINMQFPMKLHLLLQNAELKGVSNIISWLSDGRSFKVHNKEKFSKCIMPEYFTASKYKSFQRSLNLWGFETVSKGPNKGVCSHPFFIRGDPSKTNLMKRVKVKSTALDATKKSPTKGPQSTTAEEQASLSLISLNATAASNAATAAGRANSIIPSPAVWGRSHLSLIHQIAGVTPSASSILQARDAYLEQALALELLAQRERSLIDAISVIKSARQLLEPSELGAAFSTGI